jgi:hypothetical protein
MKDVAISLEIDVEVNESHATCLVPASQDTFFMKHINPILHTAWLDNHALTLKRNSAKYYFHEKSRFLHTFLKFCCESRKI